MYLAIENIIVYPKKNIISTRKGEESFTPDFINESIENLFY
jgi:hypothetical protein